MLTIAVSSRALFYTGDGDKIFHERGAAAFNRYMRKKENVPLRPGPAFNLVRKLLAMNSEGIRDRVEVVLLSRNSPDAGLRVMQSILHHKLNIERAIFSQGADRFKYTQAFGAQLFLSVNPADVAIAIERGIAAAIMTPRAHEASDDTTVRIAFDGDSVLFSDEADLVTRTQGLPAFQASEQANAAIPLKGGPFKAFITELQQLQSHYPPEQSPLRVGLFTARGVKAHERALRTLRDWEIRLDEALFSGGLPKGPFLKAFEADMFFDDMEYHVKSAHANDISAGHVPYGKGLGLSLETMAEVRVPPDVKA